MRDAPTTLKAGKLGSHPDATRDGMFIDPTPYLSLRGPYNPDNGRDGKGSESMASDDRCCQYPRGATTLGSAAMKRTRG